MAYGLNNTKVPMISKIVIFILSVIYTSVAILIGNQLKNVLPESVIKVIGSFVLFLIGLNMLSKANNGKKDGYVESDIDNSGTIDIKEAILLSSSLSADAFFTGMTFVDGGSLIFPFFIGAFQLIFLTLGMNIGRYFKGKSRIEDRNMTIISGVVLIMFSLAKLI